MIETVELILSGYYECCYNINNIQPNTCYMSPKSGNHSVFELLTYNYLLHRQQVLVSYYSSSCIHSAFLGNYFIKAKAYSYCTNPIDLGFFSFGKKYSYVTIKEITPLRLCVSYFIETEVILKR